MADRRWHGMVCGFALCAGPLVAAADGASDSAAREAWHYGQSRLQELQEFLARKFETKRRREPDWLRKVSSDHIDTAPRAGDDELQLVVQRDRQDGAELLTLRYPLADLGAVRAYVGAGVSRTVYLAESKPGPSMLAGLDRERAIGAAGEIGAEVRVNDRLMLGMDLRWMDLASDALVLRGDSGPVVADDLALGVSVGWRFR